MTVTSTHIQRVYLSLLLCNTLAASLIWGVNTLFLLEAGLSNTQAFLANAFFTIGQVLFEVPTGMLADLKGRRFSYLLGTLTLAVSTFFYLLAWMLHAPFWAWAIASMVLGLGFTFFSGATEAWLVDALTHARHKGSLEVVFAKGQMASGVAMLVGSVFGGILAQRTTLGGPYILRSLLLLGTFVIAWLYMKDWGFTPKKRTSLSNDIHELFSNSMTYGLRRPSVSWVMLSAPWISGVSFYAFYALQPYLLELYKDPKAYTIAGLAAAIVAGSQILGGALAGKLGVLFSQRTQVLLVATIAGAMALLLVGLVSQFWLAIVLLSAWGLVSAAALPVRQAYLNGLIPTQQRATVLSFDSLVGSLGGVVIQPILGRVADTTSYGWSFISAAGIQVFSLPFLWKAKQQNAVSDPLS